MPDYGHELLFGSFLTPTAADPHRVLALARLSEDVGLDLVTVQDHPYQPRHLDAWTLLSVIAASTSTIRVSPNVANLPLRPPAVLARSVASLDLLTGGRVELGLGAGAFWDAIAAVGGPRLTAAQGVSALREGIGVIRAMWRGDGSVRLDGEFHHVHGAHPGPVPAHDVGIWLGALKPRMLRTTGELADGWWPSQPYAAPEALADMNRVIDESASAAGRQPEDVRRLYNVVGRFGSGTGFLDGPPAAWAEQLAELTLTEGTSAYVLIGDDPELLRRFAGEVAPAVRELVHAERSAQVVADREPGAAVVRVPSVEPASPVPTGLGVTPTPDDGHRLSDRRLWDEDTRPRVAAPDPDRTYTDHEQAGGRHLVDVHDHLRSELRAVRDLVDQVTAGGMGVGEARSHIATMTLRQNSWTVGTYCATYCRVVTQHHELEDASVFPHLRRADPRLAPVIDRLAEEHLVIHEVLEEVDRALVAFVSVPDGAAALTASMDLLTDTLLSHLAYEESQLVEPLARLGFF